MPERKRFFSLMPSLSHFFAQGWKHFISNFCLEIGHHKAQNSYILFFLLHSLCCPHVFLDLKILMFPCAPVFRHFDDRLHGTVLFKIIKLLNMWAPSPGLKKNEMTHFFVYDTLQWSPTLQTNQYFWEVEDHCAINREKNIIAQ